MAEKIFLLEDDAYLRDGLLEMLQGRDYEVVVFSEKTCLD